jgi:hypothetical protein
MPAETARPRLDFAVVVFGTINLLPLKVFHLGNNGSALNESSLE